MIHVTFVDDQGVTRTVETEPGESAMRCATHHLISGIVGECGGSMACATCHGYVDDDWIGKIAEPSAQEREMLSGCIDVRPNSRLTCQIRLEDMLDGLTITVPDSQT